MTPMIAATIVAVAAQIAALIALLFARREIVRASAAVDDALSEIAKARLEIESVSSSRVSRATDDAASRAAISALAQASASCQRSDCGSEPRSPLAMDRITSKGPIERKRSSVDLSIAAMSSSVNLETPNEKRLSDAPAEAGQARDRKSVV